MLTAILSEMNVMLSEIEIEQLYRELIVYFGLIGAVDTCQAIENAWKDPYNRQQIEEFIKAWLRRRRKREEETLAGVV